MKQSPLLLLLTLFIPVALIAQNNYNEITLPELMKQKKEGKEVVIVDVRTDGEFYDSSSNFKQGNIGRVKGALHIPLQELMQNPEAIKKLDAYKDADVYLLCSHSYRSRAASNMLMRNGFKQVTNVQGGMTEWFRRSAELQPYLKDFYETSDIYKNISPAEISTAISSKKSPLIIGINNVPIFFYDTLTIQYYQYLPAFKNTQYFDYKDSLKLLQAVKEKPQPIVLFNTVNYGAAEMAEWLTKKGIPDVSFMVGGFPLVYEYLLNEHQKELLNKNLVYKSKIQFSTPETYCNELLPQPDVQLIDLRIDTLFNKVNPGTKHNYRHMKGASNFFADKGLNEFEKTFPDKKKKYVFVSQNGILGLALADEISRKGYQVYWLIGGLQRWEWYMNNVETFACNDNLVK